MREEKTSPKEAINELSLLLMYLTRFSHQDRFSLEKNKAWKGYHFQALDDWADK